MSPPEAVNPPELRRSEKTFYVGQRYVADLGSLRQPASCEGPPSDFPSPLEQLRFLSSEQVGRFGGWIVTPAKNPYSQYHLLVLPSPDNFKKDEDVWRNVSHILGIDLAELFEKAGAVAGRLLKEGDVFEVILGANGSGNKTMPFFHLHLVGLQEDKWQALSADKLPGTVSLERVRLLTQNIGCQAQVGLVAQEIISSFPDLALSFTTSPAGSAFIPLGGPIEVVTAGYDFPLLIQTTDRLLRQNQAGIPIDQRCLSWTVSEREGENNAILTAHNALKWGPASSGLMEANLHVFRPDFQKFSLEENARYIASCREAAGWF